MAQARLQCRRGRRTPQQDHGERSQAMSTSPLFNNKILVVNQKAKLIEVTNQYSVSDADGNVIAHVNEVGQSKAKKLLRVVSSVDQFLTHKLEITDATGAVVLTLTRPAKVFKSTVIVGDATGSEIGRIVQENVFGRIIFGLEVGDRKIGAIKAENWRAWDFAIENADGREVARVTKKFVGLAKAVFTTADNYVVEIHDDLSQPLASLVVAAALSIDTALKQDSKL
ncbi:MAG: scramblase [Actinobacteria bacterium]|nr:scramblase [Actinomycetota bacterium]